MKLLGMVCGIVFVASVAVGADEWSTYGHDGGNARSSPLQQINKSNVGNLKVAWTYRTGDAYKPKDDRPTSFEATPLFVDGTLFVGTPLGRIIALNPATGKEIWTYDSHVNRDAGYGDYATRGVSTWKSAAGQRLIYIATIDSRLIAVDAGTGKPCSEFGDHGIVDLRQGLRIKPEGFADYEETSPPAIIGDRIVVGSAVADNASTSQPSGEVRAFNASTGKLEWTWDPMPGSKTGAANAWSVLAVDAERGLVFVPTGSASPDYFGGERLGDNLFANSLVALDASTGQRRWHFQMVHHDLWDYDVAMPPTLFDFVKDGRTIHAVADGAKDGNLFIIDRETGKPVFGVEERPVPQTDVPGEVTAKTQPFPLKPPAVSVQKISAADAWGMTESDRAWCREEMSKLRADGVFTPPALRGTLQLPGNVGGLAWGGAAFDETHHLLILPANNLAAEVQLIPRGEFKATRERERKLNGNWEFAEQRGTAFGMKRRLLLGPHRLPCTAPPWSTLQAIDVQTGERKWQVPLGRVAATPEIIKMSEKWGSVAQLGGPVVTAGGLVFVAGTVDSSIYAFDVETGRELWRGALPTSARSSPMTFANKDGKQYLLVSAGSFGDAGGPLGDYVVAFSL